MTINLFRRCLIEAAGTAFLAHAIARASHASFNGFQQALLVGLTLALLIHACGRTSGAHFNPAVTLLLNVERWGWKGLARRPWWIETLSYGLAQCLGAVLALRLDPVAGLTQGFNVANTMPELAYTFVLLSLVHVWSREGKICPFAQPLAGVVLGAGVAVLVMLGGLAGAGIYNPALALALIGQGIRGVPLLLIAQFVALGSALLLFICKDSDIQGPPASQP
jgi:aquaporin Z